MTVPIVAIHFVSDFTECIPIPFNIKTSKQIHIYAALRFPVYHFLTSKTSVHRGLFSNYMALLDSVYISDYRDK